ncbi:hypothetical protein H8A97_20245 [Bradyrhizobium sp. Arg62]|uniref:hypothetical protein n=1 Tax=Bradyrhizobium TaxID=374 RepID=UPI001E458EA2|nr:MULTISPECIES: hypothetical protein [Bradyrhizobium]MCC8935733.1 hypothetical protein [Bradyrhizobium ivorense]MCC8947382.1 hypothetical protein [Bradyrhizobium brasilense]
MFELKERSKKIVLVAFDLLYLNGYAFGSCAPRTNPRANHKHSLVIICNRRLTARNIADA